LFICTRGGVLIAADRDPAEHNSDCRIKQVGETMWGRGSMPIHTLVKERHRSRELIEFLKLLDAAYPADTAIEIILDNHSARVSRETISWLAAQPIGRFTFTPTHGSWLNLIEGFFSKLARSMLRHIRVSSKYELGERLMAFIADINREPVVHTWRYKIDNAA
jgi:transposase